MDGIDLDLSRIERSIEIDASAERVWELIARPGWWINEGAVDLSIPTRRDGDVDVVIHPSWGEFRLQTVESAWPRRLVYRWLEDGESGTTVEFTIEPRDLGGVTLRVVETGFDQLGKDLADVVRHVTDNTEGWEQELAAVREYVSSHNLSE